MPRKSGAQYKKEKEAKLRSESASRSGQMKISKIFSEQFNDENSNKGPFTIETENIQCESSCVVDNFDGMCMCSIIFCNSNS